MTRQLLVDAVVRFMADGRGNRASASRDAPTSSVDELTEACLRLLGVGATDARGSPACRFRRRRR